MLPCTFRRKSYLWALMPRPFFLQMEDKFFFTFKRFYVQMATYLKVNLPLRSKMLRNRAFLGLSLPVEEKQVSYVAECLPNAIPPSELDNLTTEVHLFNLNPVCNEPDAQLATRWFRISQSSDYTIVGRIGLACCTLFHGNADFERYIGKAHDIDSQEKRNRLCDYTSTNCLLARSYLATRGLTPATVVLPDSLVAAACQAKAVYDTYRKEQKKKAQEDELRRQAEEEEKKLRERALQDTARRTELHHLAEIEQKDSQTHKEAQLGRTRRHWSSYGAPKTKRSRQQYGVRDFKPDA